MALTVGGIAQAAPNSDVEIIEHGRFKQVRLLRPQGETHSTALLFSGASGWDQRADYYARGLRNQGTLVVGIDTAAFLKVIATDGDCSFASGDLDNLGRFVEAYTRQRSYQAPLLLGLGEGAALAYGLLAQSGAKAFSGGIGVDFCPQLPSPVPLCSGDNGGLKQRSGKTASEFLPSSVLLKPFGIVNGASAACPANTARDFATRAGIAVHAPMRRHALAPSNAAAAMVAYQELALDLPETKRPAADLDDLPIIEVPATAKNPKFADVFAVLLSGDGGWAGIDQEVAEELARDGIPTVGVDSLRYFWTERQPEGLAADMDRLIQHYRKDWERPRVLLIGYSQGADVLPFILNRLPPATRAQIALPATLSLSHHAAFEFHVGAWMGVTGDRDTAPEVQQLAHQNLLVVYGDGDEAALGPSLDPKQYTLVKLPGNHHFAGDYEKVAGVILDALKQP